MCRRNPKQKSSSHHYPKSYKNKAFVLTFALWKNFFGLPRKFKSDLFFFILSSMKQSESRKVKIQKQYLQCPEKTNSSWHKPWAYSLPPKQFAEVKSTRNCKFEAYTLNLFWRSMEFYAILWFCWLGKTVKVSWKT